ncbi:methyltransferase domain protein [Asticcacaulis biprosthecium C19]|uniref:Methyltransferase domain protein n=1 Tax=Asticcacaulis biprosthecium C19 TaxID=715226 RepID=F4QHT9_9CAUL|nr:class I SAM-dependent methyltransferase [Asticcacaulis biprosthecium]EGF92826.1 methyltransferase domain protein [Asticcacaulis biprosthecium C19]
MPDITKDARFWDRIARKYAADKIEDVEGYERTLERTRQYLKPADKVLEFGCGTGTTALKLAPHAASYLATDISAEMVTIAREKLAETPVAGLEFAATTLDDLNAAPDSFDAVLGFNILHLVTEVSATVRRARSLLKPGGLLITKTPCLKEMNLLIRVALPVMQALGKAPNVSVFTSRQLETMIMAAGFEIVEIARHASKGKDTRPFIVARKV